MRHLVRLGPLKRPPRAAEAALEHEKSSEARQVTFRICKIYRVRHLVALLCPRPPRAAEAGFHVSDHAASVFLVCLCNWRRL